jgi:hypothetical protein
MVRASTRPHDRDVYQHFLFQAKPSREGPRAGSREREAARRRALKPQQWHAILDFLLDHGGSLLTRVAMSHAEGDGDGPLLWRPLQEARYDARLDELELIVTVARGATLRYLVSSPRCVRVEVQLGERVLRVQDASGAETVIRVRTSGDSRSDEGAAPQT